MKRSEAFPSKYIGKDDVQIPLIAQIRSVRTETIDQESGEGKPVVYFEGNVKPLITNLTNWMAIEDLYGDDSDKWAGKSIELYFEPNVMYAGKRVGGVRVRKTNGNTQAAQTMTAADAGEVKTPKGKRVADLTAEEVAKVLASVSPELAQLRQAVKIYSEAVI